MIGFDTFCRNYIASVFLLTEGQFVGTTSAQGEEHVRAGCLLVRRVWLALGV